MQSCPRCKSINQHGFFKHQDQWLCRFCLSYASFIDTKQRSREITLHESDYGLPFELTPYQQEVSKQIKNKAMHGSVLVEAVCGAGKTELVIDTIGEALKQSKKVGWAIPRRQVVLQLQSRLQKIFKTLEVIAVCEGYTEKWMGDLIVCTTHQLFRYDRYFDVLILDEPDAFPYKGDRMLETFANNSVVGNIIYLTATPSQEQRKLVNEGSLQHVTLYRRPFDNPLPVPIKKVSFRMHLIFWLYCYLKQTDKQVMVFVPTIRLAQRLGRLFNISNITSKTEDKENLIERFITKNEQHIICTTVLERGVTFSDVQVVVLFANHRVFDKASLIQISGRVGRDKNHPFGDCYFLMDETSKEVDQCIQETKRANASAFGV